MGQQPGLASILISFISGFVDNPQQHFKISPIRIQGSKCIKKLYISFNGLTAAPSIADVKCTMKVIDLRCNYIKQISDTYFDSSMNIINIDISNNLLMDILHMRNIARTLRHISLEGNNISSAQPLYGLHFPKLHWLQLVKNHIRTFCFSPLNFVPSIFIVKQSLTNTPSSELPDTIRNNKT